MGLFDFSSGLLPGLKPACWRGLNFWIPDTSTEVGRRVVVTYFPGVDDPAIEDLGRGDGLVRIRGLIVGDDYVAQALALMAALHAPGPGTFLHPWLGEMTAIVPAGAGVVTFTSVELRVVRFEVVLQPVRTFGGWGGAGLLPLVSTVSAVLSAISAVLWAARGFGAAAIGGGAVLGTASWAAACETSVACASVVADACDSAPAGPVLGPAVAASVTAVEAAVSLGAGVVAADALAAALVDLAVPVAEAAIGAPASAIGPGPSAQDVVAASERSGWTVSGIPMPAVSADDRAPSAPDPVSAVRGAVLGPRVGAALLLSVASEVALMDAHGAPAEAARLCARVGLLAHAVRAASEIAYESRQDALVWRQALDDAIGAAADDVAQQASDGAVLAGPAAAMWRTLGDLRGVLARDLNEVIGRLPAVRTYEPAAAISAWLLAQHFAGNDPTQVVPMLDDIARRNRLRHPAIAAGAVEVLAP